MKVFMMRHHLRKVGLKGKGLCNSSNYSSGHSFYCTDLPLFSPFLICDDTLFVWRSQDHFCFHFFRFLEGNTEQVRESI